MRKYRLKGNHINFWYCLYASELCYLADNSNLTVELDRQFLIYFALIKGQRGVYSLWVKLKTDKWGMFKWFFY